MLVLEKNKTPTGKILFADATRLGNMAEGKNPMITDDDIRALADTFAAFQQGRCIEDAGVCTVADMQEIDDQDYVLKPARYI